MKSLLLSKAALLAAGALLVSSGCGDLPPLPTEQSLDGASPDSPSDGARDSSGDAPFRPAVDAPVTAPVDGSEVGAIDFSEARPIDASDSRPVDSRPVDASRDTILDASAIDAATVPVCPTGYADCNDDDRDGCETAINTPEHCGGCKTACAAVSHGSAACVSDKCVVKCSAGYDDCDGKYDNGCETSLTTPEHCGGCKTTCGAVANGSASCADGKCAVKCNAPYQDCDGKYDNGCEIPVGQANSCNRSGLASFSGDKPPCGTPYCGSAGASDAVTNFGSWYCSFCEHCYIFGNGGSWCLYASANGNFSGERCSTCCGAGDEQTCPAR